MVSKPSAQQLALACGAAAAYVDVTDDMVTDTITGAWGRTSGFSDTRPGVFSFDLVNDTGKYTPGNVSSSLSTKVRVGMGVSHVVDGMHFAGTIRSTQPYFTGPNGLSGSSKIRVVCDDMLGDASRLELGNLLDSTFASGTGIFRWLMDESAGATAAVESYAGGTSLVINNGTVTFGSTSSHIPVSTGVVKFDSPSAGNVAAQSLLPVVSYPTTSIGSWSFWVERDNSAAEFALIVTPVGLTSGFNIRSLSGNITMLAGTNTANRVIGPAMATDTAYYCAVGSSTTFAAGVWTVTLTLYVNGTSYGSASYTPTVTSLLPAERQTASVSLSAFPAGTGNIYASHLSHTLTPINEYYVRVGTPDYRLQAIASLAPTIVLDTLPTMSSAVLAINDTSGQSALDAFNDIIRTEQGAIWTETTGTVTAPVQKVKIRGRDRPTTVDAAHTFKASEIQNAPEFTTDIENMVSSATARGPEESAVATDSTLVPYVSAASDSTDVLLRDAVDLLSWAQDRLMRGAATDVRLPQFTVDALQINRWADVSALRPGDRVRISELPSTQLGVSTIDGWIVGCSYNLLYPSLHAEDAMLFTFYMQPALPDTAIFDTHRFMSGGEMTVNTTFNSSATSISIASTGQLFTTSTDLPTTIRIDSEVLTVSAVTGASSPQTFTVARGATDPLTGLATTAAGHTAAALVEIASPSLFAF